MKETTAQQRMDLLKEIADTLHGTAQEWARHWSSEAGDDIRLRWQTDGSVIVEVDSVEVMRVQVDMTASAVEYVDAVNKPTGFVFRRTWATVPAGWFVRTPKGDWIEVVATRLDENRQMVTLDVSGQRGEWPRIPDETVSARRGTLADASMDAAMDALGEGTSILKDAPPFDPPYVRGQS